MKPGDLVRHKEFDKIYIIVDTDKDLPDLVTVLDNRGRRWVGKHRIEVISESR
jgi:hypothetical protein